MERELLLRSDESGLQAAPAFLRLHSPFVQGRVSRELFNLISAKFALCNPAL